MVKLLMSNGFNVTVIDNLSTGFIDACRSAKVIVGDYGDKYLLNDLFSSGNFDAVMHFGSLIEVHDSTINPSLYYQNNVFKTLSLLDVMRENAVNNIIYSSSAAVYGNPQYYPIEESHILSPLNPYGNTKYFVEKILADYKIAYGLRAVSLRYFNAAGADPDGGVGERHDPETHLIPLAIRAAKFPDKHILKVYGTDYQTPDGSCIRDYVHVIDLCNAHLLAMKYLFDDGELTTFNLGNGDGISVLEIINSVEKISRLKVPYAIFDRRAGDPAILVANSSLARKVLGWVPSYPKIDEIVQHAWSWSNRLLES
jgi:UDP-glucose 4-epimerase